MRQVICPAPDAINRSSGSSRTGSCTRISGKTGGASLRTMSSPSTGVGVWRQALLVLWACIGRVIRARVTARRGNAHRTRQHQSGQAESGECNSSLGQLIAIRRRALNLYRYCHPTAYCDAMSPAIARPPPTETASTTSGQPSLRPAHGGATCMRAQRARPADAPTR